MRHCHSHLLEGLPHQRVNISGSIDVPFQRFSELAYLPRIHIPPVSVHMLLCALTSGGLHGGYLRGSCLHGRF